MSIITVIGYGSLLSEQSAKASVPGLENFRLVRVANRRRVFCKVGIVFFQRYGLAQSDIKIASLSTQTDTDNSLIASAFECSSEEFMQLYEREHRFKWETADFIELLSSNASSGRICCNYSDEEYRLNKCITEDEYQLRVGQYYQGEIWRKDILPYPNYLQFCLQAATHHGQEVYQNFISSSFLADNKTTVADFLKQSPRYLPNHSDYFNQ